MSLHDLATRIAPQELTSFAANQLKSLLLNVNGVELTMLCSSDGFELASFEKLQTTNKSKLAAVSSSILAMVQAFMNELDLKGCQNITLDADNGKSILVSLPHPQFPMIALIITSQDVLLGQLLYNTKKIAQQIAEYNI